MIFDSDGAAFESTTSVNSVVWISFLDESELGPTRRNWEDMTTLAGRLGFHFEKHELHSASELVSVLRLMRERIRATNLRPIIHLDGHASKTAGLAFGPTSVSLPWSDLERELSALNDLLSNNLIVVLGTCFGLHAIGGISISKPCPFAILIGPDDIVTFGQMEDSTVNFYQSVFEENNITEAYNNHLSDFMVFFHSHKLLFVAIAKYLDAAVFGKGGRMRRERLISEVMESGAHDNVGVVRKMVKERVTANPRVLEQHVEIFLRGDRPSYTFDDIENFVRSAKSRKTSALN